MTPAFDLVIVPDFSGSAKLLFEVRSLYFLASWLEYSELVGEVPLHLACIGEPPESVRALARKCGGTISLHSPVASDLPVYANKLRGFEAPFESNRMLLLDVDILALSSVATIADVIPADAISAATSHGASLTSEMWSELYAALGLDTPVERMSDFHLTLDVQRASAGSSMSATVFPSWNSGVIMVPRESGLPALWQEHLRIVGEFRQQWRGTKRPGNRPITDEPAFATAVHALNARGESFFDLPDQFNGRWRHLYRRSPTMREFVLFHMTGSFTHGRDLEQKLDPHAWGYQKRLLARYGNRWLEHSESRLRDGIRYMAPATLELLHLRSILTTLYRRHIRPVVS
jgi:hypothetical protein